MNINPTQLTGGSADDKKLDFGDLESCHGLPLVYPFLSRSRGHGTE